MSGPGLLDHHYLPGEVPALTPGHGQGFSWIPNIRTHDVSRKVDRERGALFDASKDIESWDAKMCD